MIYYGVIHPKEGTNPTAVLLLSTLVFGAMSIVCATLIIMFCYEYWYLSEDLIYSKKLFRKRVVINLNEIEKVEKKVVPALVMSVYKSDAYIIYANNKKIVVLIDEGKKLHDLESELEPKLEKSK